MRKDKTIIFADQDGQPIATFPNILDTKNQIEVLGIIQLCVFDWIKGLKAAKKKANKKGSIIRANTISDAVEVQQPKSPFILVD